MGVTKHTFDLINRYAKPGDTMLELGSQNIYFGDHYGRFAKDMFEAMGIKHTSVDLNGEGGCLVKDLTKPLELGEFDIITNAGTSEHTNDLYACYKNMWDACKEGGYIISENPKTGNWPGHGNYYLTVGFYLGMCGELMEYGEHPAMGNTTDGWNVYGVIKKQGEFMSREDFETLEYFDK